MEQKLHKKRLKYESILKKDMDIESSRSPTTVSFCFVQCTVKKGYVFQLHLLYK